MHVPASYASREAREGQFYATPPFRVTLARARMHGARAGHGDESEDSVRQFVVRDDKPAMDWIMAERVGL